MTPACRSKSHAHQVAEVLPNILAVRRRNKFRSLGSLRLAILCEPPAAIAVRPEYPTPKRWECQGPPLPKWPVEQTPSVLAVAGRPPSTQAAFRTKSRQGKKLRRRFNRAAALKESDLPKMVAQIL